MFSFFVRLSFKVQLSKFRLIGLRFDLKIKDWFWPKGGKINLRNYENARSRFTL